MKIKIQKDYSWSTLNKEYEIVSEEKAEHGIWYKIIDDNNKEWELHSVNDKDDFILLY